MVNVPHFDLPLRYVSGRAIVVEQGSPAEIRNCVEAAVRTRLGTRWYVPDFGITDPVFEVSPIDVEKLKRQIMSSEPRAQVNVNQTLVPSDPLIDQIQIGVSNIG